MQVEVIPGGQLTAAHLEQWEAIQRDNPELASPYFSSHFTRGVAAVRRDVYVGMISEGNETIGFFPFQRGRGRAGRPVGGLLSDYQGVIAPAGARFDARALITSCGLRFFDFDSMIASQSSFQRFCTRSDCSWIIDLSEGYEGYRAQQQKQNPRRLRDTERLMRKVERDIGTLRFEALAPRSEEAMNVFEKAIEWKSAQYRRTGVIDAFSFPWIIALLKGLHDIQSPAFAGTLGALYAGDQLLAVHIGMRSRTVWHHWFATYDIAFRSYGPGILLIMHMARSAATLGLRTIDLSRGREPYKLNLATGSIPVGRGWVEAPAALNIVNVFGRWWRELEDFVRNSRVLPLAAYPGRFIRSQRFK